AQGREALGGQQEHIAVRAQAETPNGPPQAVDRPAEATAQIHPGGGQQIGRCSQRQHLGQSQPAATRKGATCREPPIGRAKQGHHQTHAQHKSHRVTQSSPAFRAQPQKGSGVAPAHRKNEQGHHRGQCQ
ncbi:MAG: hypothetical protein ACK55Z_26075, partial [bacterium]